MCNRTRGMQQDKKNRAALKRRQDARRRIEELEEAKRYG